MKRFLFLGLFLSLFLSLNAQAAAPPKKQASSHKKISAQAKAPGSLKIKAGVVMKSGDVKYLAQTEFFLLDLPLFIYEGKFYKPKYASFQEFLTAYNASPELIKLSTETENTYNIQSSIFYCDFTGKHSNVPEFQNANMKCKEPYSGSIVDSDTLPEYLHKNTYSEIRQEELTNSNYLGKAEALLKKKASCRTDFGGVCTFHNIPPGEYYLTNVLHSAVGNSTVLWDEKIKILPGKQTYTELSNFNMKD